MTPMTFPLLSAPRNGSILLFTSPNQLLDASFYPIYTQINLTERNERSITKVTIDGFVG